MSRFEIAEKTDSAQTDIQPAAFLTEMQDHRELLKVAGGKDKITAPGDTTSPESPGPQPEKSPAAKLMDETMTAAQKEVAERKTKNGTITPEDLQEILPKYFPKMKEAITLSDSTAASARKEAETEYKRLKPELEKFPTEVNAAGKRLSDAGASVPAAERAKVGPQIKELIDEKTTDARKDEIRKDLAKYPDLAESAEGLNKLLNDNAAKMAKLENAVGTMQSSLAESLMMRGLYKGTLEAGFGDRAELERVEKEAAIVQELFKKAMTMPQVLFMDPADLEPKKPLPKTWTA